MMNMNGFLYGLCATFVVFLVSLSFHHPAIAQTIPNIVVIMTDDQDISTLAYMPKTKALLADKGVTFLNSFVTFPQCCPSRTIWLSGQLTHNNGVKGNTLDWDGSYQMWKPQESNSLPVWMKAASYTTGFMGKVMNGYGSEAYHVPPGWDWWRGMKANGYYNWSMYISGGTISTFGTDPDDYSTDNMAWRAENFITNHTEPFMLFSWLFAPHVDGSMMATPAPRHMGMFANEPMPKTPAFNAAHTTGKHPLVAGFPVMDAAKVAETEAAWRKELETLQSADDFVETVINSLEATGRLANTYIIFTSDNGNLNGDWKRPGKVLPYERSIRVPLIVRGPGVPEGVTRNEIVTNVDLVATIVELGGATAGRVLDGKSILPLLSTNPVPWRSAALFTGLYDPIQQYDHAYTRWNAVRTRDRKYIVSSDGHEELYDLDADPWERFSVVSDPYYANDLIDLRAKESALKTCAGASCWVP